MMANAAQGPMPPQMNPLAMMGMRTGQVPQMQPMQPMGAQPGGLANLNPQTMMMLRQMMMR